MPHPLWKYFLSPFGSIGRAEWWMSRLLLLGAMIALSIMFDVSLARLNQQIEKSLLDPGSFSSFIGALLFVGPFWWPALVADTKRLHDRGKSGLWLILFAAIPVIGSIWYFIECGFLTGTLFPNKYDIAKSPPVPKDKAKPRSQKTRRHPTSTYMFGR
ncbi:MAG: DUF805 domain-containing protein [Pseudomonadota bacterium]